MSDKTDNFGFADIPGAACSLQQRCTAIKARIKHACQRAGRSNSDIRLLAVSKTRPAQEIRLLHSLGVNAFGENYVSDACAKISELSGLHLEWHFIGPLQSNKSMAVAAHFDWVQSADREKIIRRLADQRTINRPPLQILIQVNIDQERQKSGCDPGDIKPLADYIRRRPELNLRGLMAIPTARTDQVDRSFVRMNKLFEELKRHDPEIDTLSMGMSNDLELAIEAGSTMVRIGTDLFGPRNR